MSRKKLSLLSVYRNKVADLELDHSSSKNWWNHIKRLTGKDIKQDWQNQFLDRNCPNLLSLSNKVNNFFTSLTDHFTPLA